jgi:hypothetical protein
MIEEKLWFRRKPEGGYERRLFSRDILLNIAKGCPQEIHGEMLDTFPLAVMVLGGYFGREWAETHILDDSAPRGFLNGFAAGDARWNFCMRRIIDLAEMLVNSQSIKGVEAVFDQVACGNVESAFAELETGKILTSCNVWFRYIWPGKKIGHDFDIELRFPNGRLGCADVKSKAESTDISANTITNSLQQARKQLPPGHPGVIFLKLPMVWLRHGGAEVATVFQAAADFLSTTTRIVSVIPFYSVEIFDRRGITTMPQCIEMNGPRHKFERSASWRVLCDQLKTPETWIDLVEIMQEAREMKPDYSDNEIAKRRDQTIKNMVNTPPQPKGAKPTPRPRDKSQKPTASKPKARDR